MKMKTVCTSTFGLAACPLYGCCVKICTCLIERSLGRMILFYMERFYEGVRFSRLRGGSCPAPGKRSFGSEEEAARLRGGNVFLLTLIISVLRIEVFAFGISLG